MRFLFFGSIQLFLFLFFSCATNTWSLFMLVLHVVVFACTSVNCCCWFLLVLVIHIMCIKYVIFGLSRAHSLSFFFLLFSFSMCVLGEQQKQNTTMWCVCSWCTELRLKIQSGARHQSRRLFFFQNSYMLSTWFIFNTHIYKSTSKKKITFSIE